MDRRGPGWVLVVGLVLGALVVPRVASAVGTLVTIQSPGDGPKASVTGANQLLAAEAKPGSFHAFAITLADSSCHALATIPGTKGFVARSMNIQVHVASTTGFPLLLVFPNGTCFGRELASASTAVDGGQSMAFEPGFAVKAGGKLSIRVVNGGESAVGVYLFGYLVPPGDVPATTAIN